MYESPEPDSSPRWRRGAPQIVLAASGVVLATVFAAVASLAAGSDNATESPATQPPRKEAVRDALSIVPTSTPSPSAEQTSTTVKATTSTTTTTTSKKPTRVTTITRPDGTTTTVTTEDPPPVVTSDPPTTTKPPVTTTEPPVTTTADPTPTTTAS